MKRDMDLVRKILFKMEEQKRFSSISDTFPVKIDGYERDLIVYHMKIMAQAGLLHIDLIELPGHPSALELPKQYESYYSISWNGHEFLDAARDNGRWEKAKATMTQAGGFALDIMKQLLIQYLKTELKLP